MIWPPASLTRTAGDVCIALGGVSKIYASPTGPVESLRDVSFEVGRGEFVSLIGPSGCGKSTLLKLVAGVIPVSGGQVDVLGEPSELAKRRRHFGFVFQDPVLLAWRTNAGNVELPLEILKTPRGSRAARARELLELVGLGAFADRSPRQLSGGMRQRVSIARALATDPAILLMDEPFGALDELTRDAMNEELQAVWQRTGKTILFVTHSIPEAVFLSDRVIVMSARPGRIAAVVDVHLQRPRTQEMKDDPSFGELTRQVRRYLLRGDA